MVQYIKGDGNIFQSTPLMRGETVDDYRLGAWKCISIHSPHARGDPPKVAGRRVQRISIHSPHARGDGFVAVLKTDLFDFNPLPSCEGRPTKPQSTASASNFNPLPSCEGRQHKPPKIRLDSRQSIQQKHHSSFF